MKRGLNCTELLKTQISFKLRSLLTTAGNTKLLLQSSSEWSHYHFHLSKMLQLKGLSNPLVVKYHIHEHVSLPSAIKVAPDLYIYLKRVLKSLSMGYILWSPQHTVRFFGPRQKTIYFSGKVALGRPLGIVSQDF